MKMSEKQELELEKIKHLTRKNPDLQTVFAKMFHQAPNQFSVAKDAYNLYKTYRNLLKNKQFNINDYQNKSFENLFDDITNIALENEKRRYALSFISNKYAHLINEESLNLFYTIKEMNLPHEKVNDLVVKKIAKYKTSNEFNEALQHFIESSQNNNIQAIKNKIRDNQLAVSVLKEDHETNKLLIEAKDYKASKSLGSKNWCISTSQSFFKQYKSSWASNLLENKQYFLWDFNKKSSDKNSLIAFTMSPHKKITASHKKDDSPLKKEDVEKILKEMEVNIEPYSKNEIFSIVRKTKNSNIEEKLKLITTFMKDEGDKEFLKEFLMKNKVSSNKWGFLMRNYHYDDETSENSIKNPKLFFNALEELCWESRNHKGAFSNVDNAVMAMSWRESHPPNQNSVLELPIDIKYFWSRDSVEQFWEFFKISEYFEKNQNNNREYYTNRFSINCFEFFKENQNDDYLTENEKKALIREAIRKTPDKFNVEVVKEIAEYNHKMFNEHSNYKGLAKHYCQDIGKLNKALENAQIDKSTVKGVFADKELVNKIIKNDLQELSYEQIESLKNNKKIETSDYDTFCRLRDNNLLSSKSFFVSAQKIIINDNTDFKTAKELINDIKEKSNMNPKWNFNEMCAITKNQDLNQNIDYILENSRDVECILNFLKASEKGSNRHALETAFEYMDKEDVINTMGDIFIRKVNNMTGFSDDMALEVFFEKYPPEQEISNKASGKNSNYESLLIKFVDRTHDSNIGVKTLDYLSDEKQTNLLMKTSKAKDPIFQFLMNKQKEKDNLENTEKRGAKNKLK